MNAARKTTLTLLTGMLLCTAAGAGTTVDLTAEASRPAANDMVRATVSAEASGSNPGELARRVNQDVAEGHVGARLTLKLFDDEKVACLNPVLLTAGFDHRVHRSRLGL